MQGVERRGDVVDPVVADDAHAVVVEARDALDMIGVEQGRALNLDPAETPRPLRLDRQSQGRRPAFMVDHDLGLGEHARGVLGRPSHDLRGAAQVEREGQRINADSIVYRDQQAISVSSPVAGAGGSWSAASDAPTTRYIVVYQPTVANVATSVARAAARRGPRSGSARG